MRRRTAARGSKSETHFGCLDTTGLYTITTRSKALLRAVRPFTKASHGRHRMISTITLLGVLGGQALPFLIISVIVRPFALVTHCKESLSVHAFSR